jgi:hypothetical protein
MYVHFKVILDLSMSQCPSSQTTALVQMSGIGAAIVPLQVFRANCHARRRAASIDAPLRFEPSAEQQSFYDTLSGRFKFGSGAVAAQLSQSAVPLACTAEQLFASYGALQQQHYCCSSTILY